MPRPERTLRLRPCFVFIFLKNKNMAKLSVTWPEKVRIIGLHCEKDKTTGVYECQQWFKRATTVPTNTPVLCDDMDDSNNCALHICGKQKAGNPPVLIDSPDTGKKGQQAEPRRHETMETGDSYCSSCGKKNPNCVNCGSAYASERSRFCPSCGEQRGEPTDEKCRSTLRTIL